MIHKIHISDISLVMIAPKCFLKQEMSKVKEASKSAVTT